MRIPKRGEKGFTLIELLIVVAILGVLAAIIVPNVIRFLGKGEEEARRTEYNNIQTALTNLMVANGITSIPNPVSDATATNAMGSFPDTSSNNSAPGGKVNDPNGDPYDFVAGDKVGYVLYGHDELADDAAVVLENYVNFSNSEKYYTIDSTGKLHQWEDAAKTTEYTY